LFLSDRNCYLIVSSLSIAPQGKEVVLSPTKWNPCRGSRSRRAEISAGFGDARFPDGASGVQPPVTAWMEIAVDEE
jgi:hypothetical protein